MMIHRSIAAAIGATFLLLQLAACGGKETVVLEPEMVEPSPETARVSDRFRDLTGDQLVAVAHEPDLIGFPGDADDPTLSESSQLLILEIEGQEASSEATGLERYGRFAINVVESDEAVGATLLSNDAGEPLTQDPGSGIFWERLIVDGPGGTETIEHWLAHKPYGNLVLTWLSSERATDARWAELDRALSELAPDQKGATRNQQQGATPSGDGADR